MKIIGNDMRIKRIKGKFLEGVMDKILSILGSGIM